jgi:phosphate transport system substrate-binding protein
MNKSCRAVVVFAVGFVLVVAGNLGPPPEPANAAPRKELSGAIRVSGAWALYPMMVRWAAEFQKLHPKVRIDVSAGGAGKGATDALGGLVDIGMISRDIHPEEEKKGGFWVPVVKDAVLPTANSANPVAAELMRKGVRREVFVALWLKGEQLTWGEMVGRGQVRDQVRVYTRSDACGAAETWAKYLGGKQEDLGGVGVYGDPGVAEALQRDRLGLGYNNLNYAYDPTTGKPVRGVMVVPIDINGNGKVDQGEGFYRNREEVKRAIANGVYPSPPARDLNLLTKGKPKGITRDFMLWILRDGQKHVDRAGYIELPKQKLAGAIKKIG